MIEKHFPGLTDKHIIGNPQTILTINKKLNNNVYFSLNDSQSLEYLGVVMKGSKEDQLRRLQNFKYSIWGVSDCHSHYEVFIRVPIKELKYYKEDFKRLHLYLNSLLNPSETRGIKTEKFLIPGSIDWEGGPESKVKTIYESHLTQDFDELVGDMLQHEEDKTKYTEMWKDLKKKVNYTGAFTATLKEKITNAELYNLYITHKKNWTATLKATQLNLPTYSILNKEEIPYNKYCEGIYIDETNKCYVTKDGKQLTNFLVNVKGHIIRDGKYIILYQVEAPHDKSDILELNNTVETFKRKIRQIGIFSASMNREQFNRLFDQLLLEGSKKKLKEIEHLGFDEYGNFFGGEFMIKTNGRVIKHRGGLIGKYYLSYLFERGVIKKNFIGFNIPEVRSKGDISHFLNTSFSKKDIGKIKVALFTIIAQIANGKLENKYPIPHLHIVGPTQAGKTRALKVLKTLLGISYPSEYLIGFKTKEIQSNYINKGLPCFITEYEENRGFNNAMKVIYDRGNISGLVSRSGCILDSNTHIKDDATFSRTITVELNSFNEEQIKEVPNLLYPIVRALQAFVATDTFQLGSINRINYNYATIKLISNILGTTVNIGTIRELQLNKTLI